MARVAILILNYNGREHLQNFLPSIIKYSSGCDIIVGDNGSTDDSIPTLEISFPSVRIIKFDKNYGYAEGYNLLIEQVDAEYIALVNSDIEATPQWTEPLIRLLDSSPTIAAVQPKVLSYVDKSMFEYAGAAGGFLDSYGYPFCRGRIFDTIEKDTSQFNDECEIFWASGACFIIKKSVFIKAEGFDKTFFAHMEEIDLCWRINNLGYKIMYTGESSVHHLGGGTLSYGNSKKTYLNFRNSWMMLLKNLPRKYLFKTLLIRWCLDVVSIFYFLVIFQPLNSYKIILAHWSVLFKIGSIKFRPATTKTKVSGLLPMRFSVVWQYFINGKRKFADLIPD